MLCRHVVCAFIGVLIAGTAVAATDTLQPGVFRVDPPTLHSLGFRWYVNGDDDGDAACTASYRREGTEPWLPAMPLLRVNREEVDRDFESYGANSGRYRVGNLLAGSILFLQPDTSYEVQLHLRDPDGGQATRTELVRTRAVPVAPEPVRTLQLMVPDAGSAQSSLTYTDPQAAFAALIPGDLLLVHEGVHAGGVTLSAGGTAEAPIQIRGVGKAVLELPGTDGFNLDVSERNHVFVEDLTLRGGRIGLIARDASQLTVRRCRIDGALYGIFNDRERSRDWYIADNVLVGTDDHWVPRTQEDAAETGIVVYGQGHVVEYNDVSRYWDALTVADFGRPAGGVGDIDRHCVAIDFNNNELHQARDDLLEVDFASHNMRVVDNRLTSGHTGISAQPLYGGPAYFVGNVIYGVDNTPFKLHNWPAGLYLLHNTSISSGTAFRSAPIWQNATLRNNLILGASPDGYTMETGSPDPRTSLDYNGWSRNHDDPSAFLKFTNDGTLSGAPHFRFGTLAEMAAATGHGQHSLIVGLDDFVGVDYPAPGTTYAPGSADLRLAAGSVAVGAGTILPNVSRVTGDAADLGAYELGTDQPHYGPRP